MSKAARDPHKQIWQRCLSELVPEIQSWGFQSHPAYETGWEPANQNYECVLLWPDLSAGLLQVFVHYYPAWAELRLEALRLAVTDKTPRRLADMPAAAAAWTDLGLTTAAARIQLMGPRRWGIVPREGYRFSIDRRDKTLRDGDRVFAALAKNLPFLKAALFERYRGGKVEVENRPALAQPG